MPKRLMADAQASLTDPDRLAMESELAVIDARINDVLQRVDSGESGQLWRQLGETWKLYEKAHRSSNAATMGTALVEIGDLITSGHADREAWDDVRSLIRDRQRLVESERRRLVEAQQMIRIEQALAMMGQLVAAVRAHVRDKVALRAVATEFARLTGRPDPEQLPDC